MAPTASASETSTAGAAAAAAHLPVNLSVNFWFAAAPWDAGAPKPAGYDTILKPKGGGGYLSPEAAEALMAKWPKSVSLSPSELVGLGAI